MPKARRAAICIARGEATNGSEAPGRTTKKSVLLPCAVGAREGDLCWLIPGTAKSAHAALELLQPHLILAHQPALVIINERARGYMHGVGTRIVVTTGSGSNR